MDSRVNVEDVVARLSPTPTGLAAEADGVKSTAASTPNGIRSSPPAIAKDVAMDVDPSNASLEESTAKSDSEAETIVLPGKDGHSPSKTRKSIKHEDKSDDEEVSNAPGGESGRVDSGEVANKVGLENGSELAVVTSTLGKRKRVKHGHSKDDSTHLGNSSGLSSVPTSPLATTRSSLSKPAASDSDISRSPSPRSAHSTAHHKTKSVDRVHSRRKKDTSESGDEGERRRFARQRSSGADHKQGREHDNQGSSKQNDEFHLRKRTRSPSPPTKSHRRSISAQLPAKAPHGLSHKKKRPPPLQSTEYLSDDSSASGSSSHHRSSRLRSLAAPVTGDSNISPAKMPPHKKHVNSSGQTWLARACAAGKLDVARQRLEERPEDLNVGDNALNTPLHTASIDGHADIVKLLLDSGCIVDPINVGKDTPLHDAIENGHVEVVKLLLDAGANPRKPNGKGEDPYDLIDLVEDRDDASDAVEMREAISAAKERSSDVRKSSEDEEMQDLDSRMSHPKESPRQTPPAHEAHFPGVTSRRNAGTRAVKTSDRILYQPLNLSELRKAAASNDVESIARILDVHSNNLDDPKALVMAAKAGHHEVVGFMFAMGSFNPDPEPLANMPAESATPILAAIGRDNLQVIELLLDQSSFDPTRLVDGETYYDIARKRGGHLWRDEEAMLRKAYDKYKATHQSSPRKPRSPGLRRDGRDADHDARRTQRKEEQQPSRSHKRTTSSPKLKEPEPSKPQHRSTHSTSQSKESQSSAKRGPGRPRKEESVASEALSDRETTPLGPPKQKSNVKRSESDIAVASESENTAKPRRKLVSGKEFRGDRELVKHRRASIASNASTASIKDRREGESRADGIARKASPNLPRISKTSHDDQDLTSEKAQSDIDKQRSIKRENSKDRLTAVREENPTKRPRKSATPPRSGLQEVSDYDSSEIPQKRRKLEGESKSGRKAEGAPSSSPDQRTNASKTVNDRFSTKSGSDTKDKARLSHKLVDSPESSRYASEDVPRKQGEKSAKASKSKGEPVDKNVIMEDVEVDASTAEEERKAQNRREKEEQEAQERAEKLAREKRLEEERIEELAKQARLAREQAEREAEREEEAKRQQELERKERQRQEDAEAHAREVERQRILYQEQEKAKREERERRRAQVAEQQRAERIRVEKEKRKERLSKLPLLLRWFDQDNDPKLPQRATLFRFIEGFRYDTIRPEATGQDNGRDEWMLNTHAALLLGEKDLQLNRYTAWDRISLSRAAKLAIWQFENPIYSLTHPSLLSLRRKFPDNGEPGYKIVEQNKALFLDLDLFFIKVSDFMFVVQTIPHLRGLELVVKYRELQEVPVWPPGPGKWKQDPDIDPNQIFAPRPKYYVNGELTKQGQIERSMISTTSFGERRVPRRGLIQVFPGESDYEQLAREQGLLHLLADFSAAHEQPNGIAHGQVNGITPPSSDKSKSINGGSPHLENGSTLPNGIHGTGDVEMATAPDHPP